MLKNTNECIDSLENAELNSIDLSKPIQELFDECMNFISISAFDV